MKRFLAGFVLCVLAIPAQRAVAWNEAGHMIVAEIAWRQLDDTQR